MLGRNPQDAASPSPSEPPPIPSSAAALPPAAKTGSDIASSDLASSDAASTEAVVRQHITPPDQELNPLRDRASSLLNEGEWAEALPLLGQLRERLELNDLRNGSFTVERLTVMQGQIRCYMGLEDAASAVRMLDSAVQLIPTYIRSGGADTEMLYSGLINYSEAIATYRELEARDRVLPTFCTMLRLLSLPHISAREILAGGWDQQCDPELLAPVLAALPFIESPGEDINDLTVPAAICLRRFNLLRLRSRRLVALEASEERTHLLQECSDEIAGAAMNLCDIRCFAGKSASAQAAFAFAAQRLNNFSPFVHEALVKTGIELADTLLEAGNLRAVVSVYRRILAFWDRGTGLPLSQKVELLGHLSNFELEAGNRDAAAEYFQRAETLFGEIRRGAVPIADSARIAHHWSRVCFHFESDGRSRQEIYEAPSGPLLEDLQQIQAIYLEQWYGDRTEPCEDAQYRFCMAAYHLSKIAESRGDAETTAENIEYAAAILADFDHFDLATTLQLSSLVGRRFREFDDIDRAEEVFQEAYELAWSDRPPSDTERGSQDWRAIEAANFDSEPVIAEVPSLEQKVQAALDWCELQACKFQQDDFVNEMNGQGRRTVRQAILTAIREALALIREDPAAPLGVREIERDLLRVRLQLFEYQSAARGEQESALAARTGREIEQLQETINRMRKTDSSDTIGD